jgi:hypothetical protein
MGTEAEVEGEIIMPRSLRGYLFRLKAPTAAQLLRLVNIPAFPSDFGSSTYVVLVL